MRIPRIEFDPNASRGGLHIARLEDADAPLAQGDVVVAFEPEQGICFDARVGEVDDKYAYLTVDNSTMRKDVYEEEDGLIPSSSWRSYLRPLSPAQTRSTAPRLQPSGTPVLLPTG